eukprot:4714526-Pyramimonas_sp.AAC.1
MWPGWFYWLVFLSAVVLTWMFTRQAMENRHAEELRKYCTRYEYLRSMDAQWSTVAAGNSFEWINTIQRMLWSWHLEPELAEVGRYGSQLSCTRATNGGSFVVISGTVSAAGLNARAAEVIEGEPIISHGQEWGFDGGGVLVGNRATPIHPRNHETDPRRQ